MTVGSHAVPHSYYSLEPHAGTPVPRLPVPQIMTTLSVSYMDVYVHYIHVVQLAQIYIVEF